MKIDALLDTNVVIALLATDHPHYSASIPLFETDDMGRFAIAAHTHSETYSTLTRQGQHAPFRFSPDEAWAALENIRAITTLVGLTAPQTLDVIMDYARIGGVGPRLYDRLIGEAATRHNIPAIVTWNIKHIRSLFPALSVVTPAAYIRARRG